MTNEIKQRIEQINNGIVPEGYKKTRLGIIPYGWEVCHLNYLFSRLTRKNKENNGNVLTISAQKGLISQTEFFNKDIASDDKSNYYLLYKGDFAYNKSYSSGYPYGAIKELTMYDKGIVSPLYICMQKTNNNKCPSFWMQYFEAGMLNREIKAFAQEGARNHGLLNIAVGDFFNSNVILPPIEEQEKIAEILSTQDKIIELKQKRIEEKKKQKTVEVYRLIKKYEKEHGKKLKDYLIEKSVMQEPTPSEPLMAFIADKGIVSKGERYDRSHLVTTENKRYKRTDLNDFIYSSNNLDVGSIGLNTYGSAVISQVYEIFEVKENAVPSVLSEFIQYPKNLNKILRYRQGALYGQYKIHSKDFLSVVLSIPNIQEQIKISKYIEGQNEIIELLQKDLEQEKQKRKALMQLLLTGIVRVK